MHVNGHILIVEDEPINSTFIEHQLSKLGYSIAGIASSGETAIELAKTNKPELVLMDIQLEGELDGIETARILYRSMGIPVVYLTSTTDDETIERASETDAFGYLQKPFQQQEMHSTLQMALAKSRTERLVREERKWFTAALKLVTDGIIAADPTGAVKLLNPAAERLTGWKQQEALCRDIDEVLHTLDPVSGIRAESVVDQSLANDATSITHRRLLVSRDGSQTSIEQTTTCIVSDSGEVTGILVVIS